MEKKSCYLAKVLYICTQNRQRAMKAVLLSIVLLGLAVVMLGVKVLFVKGAKFPMGHHAHHPRNGVAGQRKTKQ
ncbi:MAG: hypothetical protein NC102_01840 [Clostridium sp.]|nr:hypothetical protein [Clostridium sp.]